MCQKLPYCARRIDPCLLPIIYMINQIPNYYTLLSCCGHNSQYSKTIVVFNSQTNEVFEYYSQIILSHGLRKSRKYYKRDINGNYYIPELIEVQKEKIYIDYQKK